MRQKTEDYVESVSGKLSDNKNGKSIARRSKKGKTHCYQMNQNNNFRTPSQSEQIVRFRNACAEADRQLKIHSYHIEWVNSFRTSNGVLNGKQYTTLRGFVIASCYQNIDTMLTT